MAGSDERRRSGEHYMTPLPSPQQQFVSLEHFNGFTEECRGFFGDMRSTMSSVEKQMAQGSTRFALMDSELKRQTKRSDDHSGHIKTLLDERIAREAREEQVEQQEKPRRDIWFEVVKAVIIATVLGAGAVAYNLWRDQEIAHAASSAISTPTKPLSRPANP